jgi:hypothetical protein
MNLVQIRNAILETVYIGVIEAYLRSKMHGQSWNKQYGMQARSGPMLRGQLAQEVDDFMAVQKNEHGALSFSALFVELALTSLKVSTCSTLAPRDSCGQQACSPTCGSSPRGYVLPCCPNATGSDSSSNS